jgi:16S rRNA (guanine(966)-N(2))-methyltransferase RsmD
MRIIAGELRGRQIEAPPGLGTRPMLDRVREALFSKLDERWNGARVLDLFAGSGSLGIEALSRGAAHARFVERDRAVLRVLRANLAALELAQRASVVAGDALAQANWTGEPGERFDVVLFDPPYPLLDEGRSRALVLGALEKLVAGHLEAAGVAVFHAPGGKLHELTFERYARAELREYGTNALWYLSPREGPT